MRRAADDRGTGRGREPASRPRGRPRDVEGSARRREEILEAATEVFAARGYRQTEVQEIADRLGIGKGTVYRHVPSKRELFLAAVDRGMRLLNQRVESEAERAQDPLERVERAIIAYLDYFEEHPEIAELVILERAGFGERRKLTYFRHQEVNVEPWQDLFRRLIREGRVRDIPVERITGVIGDLLYGTMFTNVSSGRMRSSRDQARDILDIVFRGILPRPGGD